MTFVVMWILNCFEEYVCAHRAELIWLIFCMASIMLTAIGGIEAWRRYKTATHTRSVWRPMQLFTVYVFAAMMCMMLPAAYLSGDFGTDAVIFRPIWYALNYTMRAFILDGGFGDTIGAYFKEAEKGNIFFYLVSLWGVFLYVLAPGLTFVNVLSIFKNWWNEFLFDRIDKRPCYIFSELNEKSIALAKSIQGNGKKAHFVFTDVFEQNDEPDYELLLEARNMRAICMKKDVTHVDLLERKGNVEVFLIGDDESENVRQAVKITAELDRQNRKHNVKVFVFSRQKSGAYIIDSLRHDHLMEDAKKRNFAEDTFKLRRINEVQQLVWHTVPDMNVFDLAECNGGEIPALIVGMGSYGMEFFKMLVWFCQFEGVRLRLTVVDKQPAEAVEAMINRECPELLKRNRIEEEGESFYDIEIVPGIDMETDGFDALICYDGEDPEKQKLRERLKQVKIAIVGMGNDDLNIETAVHLRSLYDRVHGVISCWKVKKEEKKDEAAVDMGTPEEETAGEAGIEETLGEVREKAEDVAAGAEDAKKKDEYETVMIKLDEERLQIYAVVYDEEKSGILQDGTDPEFSFLRNHQGVPYHIRFIGAMSSQFRYKNIFDTALEKAALAHHCGWVDLENLEEDEKRATKIDEQAKYEQYEYFRQSSMAKELYNREVMDVPPIKLRIDCSGEEKNSDCMCPGCRLRKSSEHMRWNAYMRVMGFSYSPVRADRAMLHDKLKKWEKLSAKDRAKDADLAALGSQE